MKIEELEKKLQKQADLVSSLHDLIETGISEIQQATEAEKAEDQEDRLDALNSAWQNLSDAKDKFDKIITPDDFNDLLYDFNEIVLQIQHGQDFASGSVK